MTPSIPGAVAGNGGTAVGVAGVGSRDTAGDIVSAGVGVGIGSGDAVGDATAAIATWLGVAPELPQPASARQVNKAALVMRPIRIGDVIDSSPRVRNPVSPGSQRSSATVRRGIPQTSACRTGPHRTARPMATQGVG
jgi:hypothetical protein